MRRTLTYLQARLLLLVLGLALSIGQALLAWERGAAPLEVLAPILYIPVFAGAVAWLVPGGIAGASLSSVIYGVLLLDSTREVGSALFVGLLVNRVATFFAYGFIVAMGAGYLENRLRKLELHDQVDDATDLYNSAFFLEDTGLELARSNRYRTIFSVAELTVERDAFRGLSKRRYRRALRALSARIRRAARTVDRTARLDEHTRDRILVVLPETDARGAAVFAGRLEAAARDTLAEAGCRIDNGLVAARSIAYPGDAGALADLREIAARIDAERRAIRAS